MDCNEGSLHADGTNTVGGRADYSAIPALEGSLKQDVKHDGGQDSALEIEPSKRSLDRLPAEIIEQ